MQTVSEWLNDPEEKARRVEAVKSIMAEAMREVFKDVRTEQDELRRLRLVDDGRQDTA